MADDDRTVISRRVPRVPPGTRLNGVYEIDALVDMGGMSEIYKGHNIQTHDEVAIKAVLPEFANDEQMVGLFRREALILNRLSHESVIRYHVFSYDQQSDLLYLAMEFVNGPTLRDRIKQRQLSQIEACRLVAKVAEGMRTVHAEGVVHRDLSTDNIVLVNGDVNRPKVIDFGIARAGEGGDATIIQSGFAGKYNYVSPEQLGLYGGKIGPASDIYSLGLVFAAALLGRPLDMAGSHAEVVTKRQSVPDLSQINPGVKPLIERMLQPNPANRPQSMDDVVMALDIALGNRRDGTSPGISGHAPPRPRPVVVPGEPSRPRRRYGGVAAAALLVLALGAGGLWAATQTDAGRKLAATLTGAKLPAADGKQPDAPVTPSGKSEAKAGPDGTVQQATGVPAGASDGGAEGTPVPEADARTAGAAPPSDPPAGAQTATAEGPQAPQAETGDVEPAGQVPDGAPTETADATISGATDESAQPPADGAAASGRTDPPPAEEGSATDPQVAMTDPASGTNGEVTSAAPEQPQTDPAQWVAAFKGGDCFLARSVEVASNSVTIEGFGVSVEPFQDLEQRFASAFGFEPSIGMRAVSEGQCPLLDFVRDTGGGGMAIAIDNDMVSGKEALSARVSGIPQRHMALFVSTPKGAIVNVTSRATRKGKEIAVEIPSKDFAVSGDAGYLLIAVSAGGALKTLDRDKVADAEAFVEALEKEAKAKGGSLAVAVKYFRRK